MAKRKRSIPKKKSKPRTKRIATKRASKRKPSATSKRPKKKKRTVTSSGVGGGQVFSELRVIRIVLDVAGKFDIAEDLDGVPELELEANLDYTGDLLNVLALELETYVQSIDPAKSFTDEDLADCETVEDVVDQVKEKLK